MLVRVQRRAGRRAEYVVTKPMHWTSNRPTISGYYWIKDGLVGGATVVYYDATFPASFGQVQWSDMPIEQPYEFTDFDPQAPGAVQSAGLTWQLALESPATIFVIVCLVALILRWMLVGR